MLTNASLQDQFQATIDLLRGRTDAVRRFDISMDGFWASFQIVAIAFVPYFFIVLAEYQLVSANSAAVELGASSTPFFVSKFIGLPLDWVLFPLAMIPLSRWLGVSKRYVPYVVVRNWTNLPIYLFYAVPSVLLIVGLVGQEGFMLLSLVAFGLALRLRWLTIRVVLGVDIGVAIALIIIDVLLGLLLASLISSLFGVG